METQGMKKLLPALLLPFLLFAVPAHAADKKKEDPAKEEAAADEDDEDADEDKDAPKPEVIASEDGKSWHLAPDYCDFEITFPEEPQITQKCIPGEECFEQYSYTMVYDLRTTVDISVICNPSPAANYERYQQNVMKAALNGMIDERELDNHSIRFEQKDEYRSAGVTGTGKTGQQEKIYTGQLWVGKNSIFTIQAELIGSEHPVADKSFSDILRSIKYKGGKQQAAKPKPATIPKGNDR